MKAKLIKVGNDYFLKVNDTTLATSVVPNLSASIRYSLSLKNCQAIENSYDLDEIVFKYIGHKEDDYNEINEIQKEAVEYGFQKAVELLSYKKFSEEDMLKAFITGVFTEETSDHDFEFTELMKDLQQTEWDVEIVTATRMENGKSGLDVPVEKPKLDPDGRLILKRI